LSSTTHSAPAIWGLVPAAGSGARMRAGMPKQYLPLLGRPVIQHTLERLCAHPRVRGVLVGLAPDDSHWSAASISLPKLLGTYAGGATRAHTVLNGLQALAAHAAADDWVMVHDAVRPCLRLADLDALIAAALTSAGGALLALPVSDTVKRVDGSNLVLETVTRTNLWRALTPQMFRIDQLEAAVRTALARGVEITDEASAIEAAGGQPLTVAGHPDNIKITMPQDLPLAELFLHQQERA
jgi:2-C-methyl-D-erythritol 4-phosphate cytidylyltransferase